MKQIIEQIHFPAAISDSTKDPVLLIDQMLPLRDKNK